MSERIELIKLEIGLSDVGVYCTTYLTENASFLKDEEPEFKAMLDNVVAAVAQALTDSAADAGNEAKGAKAWGPGAEILAARLHGTDVEIVDRPGLSDLPDVELPLDAPVH